RLGFRGFFPGKVLSTPPRLLGRAFGKNSRVPGRVWGFSGLPTRLGARGTAPTETGATHSADLVSLARRRGQSGRGGRRETVCERSRAPRYRRSSQTDGGGGTRRSMPGKYRIASRHLRIAGAAAERFDYYPNA